MKNQFDSNVSSDILFQSLESMIRFKDCQHKKKIWFKDEQ